jgi:serine/threonine-protein kinase
MVLAAGSRLGSYEVLSSIGAGGMGEVYHARDTKLRRDVAIKALPEDFYKVEERVARFRREAELLAALNHPNVAAIHGLEEIDGRTFLIMELVEGKTLADRIAQGPIPTREALPLFVQIAEGLSAAHEKGIVHRDLKPANLQISPEDRVKILDFGLAKAFAGDGEPTDSSHSPTLMKGTALGAVMGTAFYMSPEQARGKSVDKRTDVWSFGCVLYEALTGRKAFDGETVTDVLGAIVNLEPDWKALPDGLHPALHRVLRRSLEKKREERLHDIADARLDIKEALAGGSDAPAVGWKPSRLSVGLFLSGIALGALMWALANSVMKSSESTGALPAARLTIPLPNDVMGLSSWAVDISSDGRQILYTSMSDEGQEIVLRAIDSTETRVLGSGRWPFFSPDGRFIAYGAMSGELQRIPLEGGSPSPIARGYAVLVVGRDWAPDDYIYLPKNYLSGIYRVPASGGDLEPITVLAKGEAAHWWPDVLPNGKTLLYTVLDGTGETRIDAQDLESGKLERLIQSAYNARYVASGHILFGRAGSLWAVPFDLDRSAVSGPPAEIRSSIYTDINNNNIGAAVSSNGTLVYAEGESNATLVWVDSEGREEPALESRRRFGEPRVSPEGHRVAATVSEGVDRHVWLVDLVRGSETKLSFLHDGLSPQWSPRGEWVYFTSDDAGRAVWDLFRTRSDGSGPAELVLAGATDKFARSISPDERWLILDEDNATDWNITLLELDGSGEVQKLASSPFNEFQPALSPDAKWLAYVSDESGRQEVYLQPFGRAGGKILVSTQGGNTPLWSPDGKNIYYLAGGHLISVDFSSEPSPKLGRPRPLFRTEQYRRSVNLRSYDIHPDGDRFLFIRPERRSDQLHVVLNWFDELKRLAPRQ